MKKYFFSILLTATVAWALFNQQIGQNTSTFDQFKTDYQKHYTKEGEEEYRKSIYLKNLLKIA
jgi:hypothetical protein